MPENDPNLEENVGVSDLSSISLDDMGTDDILDSGNVEETTVSEEESSSNLLSNSLNENMFLESGYEEKPVTRTVKDGDNIGSYLRWFFFSGLLTLIGVAALAFIYSFDTYITQASQNKVDSNYQEYVEKYKDKLGKVKDFIGINNKSNYSSPTMGLNDDYDKWSEQAAQQAVNEIINASDIDYIEKKDLLSSYAEGLVNKVKADSTKAETLRQDIAKQGFLPKELETLLSENETIDTIQRSLNALEIIKFSTATKVFSYMNTALITILEMVKMNGINVEAITQLFDQINSKGEKDITAYVYMCYLNPFEVSANCDTIGDLDLYYSLTKDTSINIKLFKNVMNAISQLLEKEDTTLFSITFKGFNAQAKNISFNIEVYTNQEDERNLLSQGKKNPNIFILTNIINLLKQSSFIIGAEINTNEINVDTRTVNWGGISRAVNYSSMDFTVPIQKSSEREIFDYIDLDSIQTLVSERTIKLTGLNTNEEKEVENNIYEDNEIIQEDELREENK